MSIEDLQTYPHINWQRASFHTVLNVGLQQDFEIALKHFNRVSLEQIAERQALCELTILCEIIIVSTIKILKIKISSL